MRRVAIVFCCLAVFALPAVVLALVNINTAGSTELQTLNGIGPSKAQAIIDYRTQNGPFATIEEIQQVSGIGPTTFSNIKNDITVGDTTDTQADTQSQTQNDATSSPPAQSTQSEPVPSYVPPPVPVLFADAGESHTVIVGADTQFTGRAYNREQEIVEHVRFNWNFGDGSTAEGQSVLHHWAYPGRYVLVLTIAENTGAASDRIIITAEPAKLTFAVNPDGSISIGNRAGRDLDLSGWLVRSYNELFKLPDDSIVLSGETLRIPHETLKFYAGTHTELDYPNGVPVPLLGESAPQAQATATPVPAPKPSVSHPPAPSPALVEAPPESEAASTTTTTLSQSALAAEAAGGSGGALWWLGALGLAFFAAAAVFFISRTKGDEWDIEEVSG